MKDSQFQWIRVLTEGCDLYSKDERGFDESDAEMQVPQWTPRDPVCQKNCDEAVCLQSEGRKEWIRERLPGTVDGWSSATLLARLPAVSLLGENK